MEEAGVVVVEALQAVVAAAAEWASKVATAQAGMMQLEAASSPK